MLLFVPSRVSDDSPDDDFIQALAAGLISGNNQNNWNTGTNLQA